MRILGINIPEEKRIEIGLTAVYGIGRPLAQTILDKSGVARSLKPKDITVAQENDVQLAVVVDLAVEHDPTRAVLVRHGLVSGRREVEDR